MDIRKTDRIIEMAWEDRTTFDAIKNQFGIDESEVIKIMRKNLKQSSFKLWRKRVSGRYTKHQKVREKKGLEFLRFKCSRQRNISNNKFK
ncbi:MAG: TIGR03643 family protein [Cryomorphaceae bacterium]|nr:MAG: TIGR03643 family protein [Cryomorphaceae bacterium]